MQLRFFASGDGPFYYSEQMQALPWLPPIWESFKGFGENLLPRLWIDYPFRLVVKILSQLGLSWWVIEKFLWIAVLMLGMYSMYTLGRKFFGTFFSWMGSVIYMVNTYTLLLFGGGQLGIFLAYSFVPLVLLRYINTIDEYLHKESHASWFFLRNSLIHGLSLALLIVFDLRIAYLTGMLIALYYGWSLAGLGIRKAKKALLTLSSWYLFVIPIFLACVIHAFWILPILLVGGGPSSLSDEFTGVGMLKFLSVADFSHTVSLLHPNWPENLFGKVYFLQPEFLIIPLIAFSSLLFVHGKSSAHQAKILFFGILACMGAFLSKGVNGPLGGIYELLYAHVPGFVMFRDPTKFYLFTALGYAVLIPFFLQRASERLSAKRQMSLGGNKISWPLISIVLFALFWLFTIRPVLLGQLGGNFRPVPIPQEVIVLKDVLLKDSEPSRTLWVPSVEKFAYASDLHPAIPGETLFHHASLSGVMSEIEGSEFQTLLYESGVKYVVVPTDVSRRMFLRDYTFDAVLRENLIVALSNTGLVRDMRFKDLAVFVNPSFSFKSDIPQVVKHQEYWSRVGLAITVISLTLVLRVLMRKPFK